jgi:hypothetical protein
MFELKSIEEIKYEIFCKHAQDFPKSINFPFNELYVDIVTRIKVIKKWKLSWNCVLYNSIEALEITKKFSDKKYWTANVTEAEVKRYWFIGDNGEVFFNPEYWIMDVDNKVYLYNHFSAIPRENRILDLDLNFEKWLQFAFLNKEIEEICDEGKYTKKIGKEYYKKLKEISKKLAEDYPYSINPY